MSFDHIVAIVLFAILAFLTCGCINLALGNQADFLSQLILKIGKSSLMYTAGGLGFVAFATIAMQLVVSTMVLLFLFVILAVIFYTTKGEAH